MIDPPSQQLIERLAELGLCTAGDISRCKPLVRKLARDLPTFDIVWLDALVQRRLLTPFQANLLAESPERLQVGPFVLVDEIRVEHDVAVYRAQTTDGKTNVCLSVVNCSDADRGALASRLKEKIARFSQMNNQSLALPRACQIHGDSIIVVEPHVEGPNLAELMNRRGRFEPNVVLDIASQLLVALGKLHDAGETHGDFRLANIILTKKGRAVLAHAGIRACMRPEMTVHSPFPADCHNAVAPETIGIQRFRTPASDLYGLGCLLWHLLAGRPPFISADPLEKLVRHQTEQIGDISDWNPDAPPRLVSLVNQLTQHDATLRPQSAAEALDIIKKPSRSSQRRLANFHHKFRGSVPGTRPVLQFNSSYAMAASVLLFAMVTIAFTEPNSRSVLLNIASQVKQFPLGEEAAEAINTTGTTDDTTTSHEHDDERWTKPNHEGVISFAAETPVTAKSIVHSGKLTIRGDATKPAVIHIPLDQPWRLSAEEIELENLIIELEDASSGSLDSKSVIAEVMVVLQSQNVTIRNCTFRMNPDSKNGVRSTIAWKADNADDALGGTASLEDVVFANTGTAVVLGHGFGTVTSINTLKTGPGALLELRQPILPQRGLSVQLHQTTVRDANAVVHFGQKASQEFLGQLELIATSSAFALVPKRSGLLFFNQAVSPQVLAQSVRVSGRESLLSPGIPIVAALDAKSKSIEPIEVQDLLLEGIIATSIEFSTDSTNDPEQSEVAGFKGPRLSSELPGYKHRRQ